MVKAHFLAPPFGLPDGRDARLMRALGDDDWASAATLLRDVVTPETTEWKWLVLLAYVRFRDAAEVLVDELAAAAREALTLLDRAAKAGAPFEAVAPLRDAAEAALDALSREEAALLHRWQHQRAGLSADELEHLAFLLRGDAPARAAEVFDALDAVRPSPGAKALAALCRGGDGATLEGLLSAPWEKPERLVLEELETALLLRATGPAFTALWQQAEANGRRLDFPFPSAWPNQERLFFRAWALGDYALARRVGQHLRDARGELPQALAAQLDAAGAREAV